MKEYRWKTGHIKKNAQEVGEYLESLREEHGRLSPEIVLEAARPKDSLIHDLFEWNSKKAAEAYRLAQAGQLIRHLVVRIEDAPELEPIRAFVRVVDAEEEKDYVPIRDAMSDPLQRQQVLSRARDELSQWHRRYKRLEELASIINAIEVELKSA